MGAFDKVWPGTEEDHPPCEECGWPEPFHQKSCSKRKPGESPLIRSYFWMVDPDEDVGHSKRLLLTSYVAQYVGRFREMPKLILWPSNILLTPQEVEFLQQQEIRWAESENRYAWLGPLPSRSIL